jgi:hypothetical protein
MREFCRFCSFSRETLVGRRPAPACVYSVPQLTIVSVWSARSFATTTQAHLVKRNAFRTEAEFYPGRTSMCASIFEETKH